MNIDQARYLSLRLRSDLSRLYEQKAFFKKIKKSSDENGNLNSEFYCHNKIKKISKEIAKLTGIQKQLKADISYSVAIARANRNHSL